MYSSESLMSSLGSQVAQLLDIPVGVEQAEVDHAHVAAQALDLLQIPQGKGVVVPVGKQDAVGFARLQDIVGVVVGDVVARAILLVVELHAVPAGSARAIVAIAVTTGVDDTRVLTHSTTATHPRPIHSA